MNKKVSGGFTIVETMIVLAVTSIMFLSVTLLINGKQQRAQFQAAIKDVQSQIQQVISESTSGYNQMGNATCSAATGEPRLSPGSADSLGTNVGCVFLGKTLVFSKDSDEVNVIPVVGLRNRPLNANFDFNFTQDLKNSKPLLSPDVAASKLKLQYGLTPVWIKGVNSDDTLDTHDIGSLSFILTPAVGSNDGKVSGSQNVNLVIPIVSSSLTNTLPAEASAVTTDYRATTTQFWSSTANKFSVMLCFKSGSTNQSFLSTIGVGGNGLGQSGKVYSGDNCGVAA